MSAENLSDGAVQQTPLANLSSLAAEGGNTQLSNSLNAQLGV